MPCSFCLFFIIIKHSYGTDDCPFSWGRLEKSTWFVSPLFYPLIDCYQSKVHSSQLLPIFITDWRLSLFFHNIPGRWIESQAFILLQGYVNAWMMVEIYRVSHIYICKNNNNTISQVHITIYLLRTYGQALFDWTTYSKQNWCKLCNLNMTR